MSNGLRVQIGMAGATPIIADIGNGVRGGADDLVAVQLTTDYQMSVAPGYPFRPNTGGQEPFSPRILQNGSIVRLLAPEAAALVDAGVAIYA